MKLVLLLAALIQTAAAQLQRAETTIQPPVAPRACPAGAKNFPFLKPWVDKLGNFVVPYEVGSNEGSLFFAVGATAVPKGTAERWKTDSVTLPIEWKRTPAKLETAWLGPEVTLAPSVNRGPGKPLQAAAPETLLEAAKRAPGYWARLWSRLFAPEELELLSKCTRKGCKIKFNDEELKAVAGASNQYRLNQYRDILKTRIERYKSQGQIYAYEGSAGALQWEDLPVSAPFPSQLGTHFWLPRDRKSFGYEVLDAEPGHHKPVTALFSRQCERRGSGDMAFTACTDLVLYNNHYFDFWGRIVLFFPWCDGEIVLAYEAVDVDQVKSSRTMRVLFGSEMRKLFGVLLETRLRRLHMLGS